MASKKLTWLLILQAWTMLWVIIGHAPLTITEYPSNFDKNVSDIAEMMKSFAYSFHMPLFIMISGYLFYRTRISKNSDYLKTIKEKFMRLGIPYIVFITIAIVVKLLVPHGVDRQVKLGGFDFVMNYVDPYNGALREMWFVASLLIYFLLYPLYVRIFKMKSFVLPVVIAIGTAMYYVPNEYLTSLFAINKAIHNFIFFFLGLLISHLKLDNLISNWRIISLSSIGYIICYILNISLLISISASIAFWGLAIKIDKAFTSDLFHTFRERTYQIFLIGIFAQIFVKILAKMFIFQGSYFVWWLVCILLGIYFPVLICKIPIVKNNKYIRLAIGL